MDQQEQELAQLQQQLREAIAAEDLFNMASGKLIEALIAKRVTLLTRQIVSDKFLKDHTGYQLAVMEVAANQKLLRELHAAATPIRKQKIQEKLEEADANL